MSVKIWNYLIWLLGLRRVRWAVKPLSVDLVCLHEAGHAAAARMVNTPVFRMELRYSPPPLHGLTKIYPSGEAGVIIACGGFAVESWLFKKGRLVANNGLKLTETEHLSEAFENARIDMEKFFSIAPRDHSISPQSQFRVSAGVVEASLDFALVEKIAAALKRSRSLTEKQIASIS